MYVQRKLGFWGFQIPCLVSQIIRLNYNNQGSLTGYLINPVSLGRLARTRHKKYLPNLENVEQSIDTQFVFVMVKHCK